MKAPTSRDISLTSMYTENAHTQPIPIAPHFLPQQDKKIGWIGVLTDGANNRKKFLKLRHVFRERMRESNALFEEEERAKRIVGRLQEQNEYVGDLPST